MSRNRTPVIQAVFDAIAEIEPFGSIEEGNRLVAERMLEYNARPQAELGGLSPDAMGQLLYGDWKSQGALRLEERLTLDDLSSAAILSDARTLLEYIRTEGPVKETAARNLPRAAVASVLPRLRMPRGTRISRDEVATTPANEGDVPWLSELRHVLIFGNLLARRKGVRITPLGRALLSDNRAGELFGLIFRTFFRVLDLSVLDGGNRHQGLQATLAYSLYMLRSVAREWKSPRALALEAWLESAKDPPDRMDVEYGDLRHISFQCRVLDPLVQFGLLGVRSAPREAPGPAALEYRCAPLFWRFLRFELRRG